MGYIVPKTTKKMKHGGVTFQVWQEESTSGYTYWHAWALGIGPLASSDIGDGGAHGRAVTVARAKAKIDARPNMAAEQRAYADDRGNWPGGVKPKEYHLNPRKAKRNPRPELGQFKDFRYTGAVAVAARLGSKARSDGLQRAPAGDRALGTLWHESGEDWTPLADAWRAGWDAPAKRNPVVRRHKTVAEMRAAGVPDYFEKIQKRGEAHRPSTMLYETGEQRPVATHSGHYLLSSRDHTALMHRRPVGADPDDTEYTVRGLYDVWGRRKNPKGKKRNPVPRASKAGPSGPRYGSGPERYYISDTTAAAYYRHIAPLTAENQHAAARLYLARTVLASPTFTEKVKEGNARMDRSHTYAHQDDNYDAWKANHALLNRMLAQVKRRTTPAGYAMIHGAF